MSQASTTSDRVASTSRTQTPMSHASGEAELCAMTQAAVESLAIKHLMKEFKSAILSRDVKIIVKSDSSAGKTMASRPGISRIKAFSAQASMDPRHSQ